MVSAAASAARAAMILAATAGLLAPPAAAADSIWQVKRSANGACTMASVHGDSRGGADTSLAFVYDPALASLSFLVANPRWDALPEKEGNPAPLHLRFNGAANYSEWISEKAPVRRVGGGSRVVVGDWGADYSAHLAEALTSASQVSVRFGATDLGTYDLDDAAAAYRELRKCVARG